jgi:hypothetical protein
MRTGSFGGMVTIALAVSVVPCGAQALEQPLRSAPPRDPDRTTSQLTLTASALGGYDDHLTAGGGFTSQSPDIDESGYTGFGEVAIRYRRGKKARSFFLEGSSYLLSYSSLSMDSPVGGQILAGGDATFGRSNRIEVVQHVRTDPYVAFGAFGPLGQDLGPGAGPDANPVNGLTPNRSWGSLSSASVDWHWTPRTTFSTGYEYRRNEYIGDVGFDNRAHMARLALDRSLTRTTALTALYRYTDTLLVEPARNENVPVTEQTGEMGFDYEKPLSRTRRIGFSAGAGATHIETVSRVGGRPLKDWTPSGHASIRADLGRTWAISADYRRGVTFLDGITPEFFLADVVLLRTEGTLGRSLELTFSTGYSNGAQTAGLVTGRYETFTLAAQARRTIARAWAVLVSYNRSDYRLFGFPAPPLGPTPRFDRNAIRVGMTYFFAQSSTRTPRPARPGRTGS